MRKILTIFWFCMCQTLFGLAQVRAETIRITPPAGLEKIFGTLFALTSSDLVVVSTSWEAPFPPTKIQVFSLQGPTPVMMMSKEIPAVYEHTLTASDGVHAVTAEGKGYLFKRVGNKWFPAFYVNADAVAAEKDVLVGLNQRQVGDAQDKDQLTIYTMRSDAPVVQQIIFEEKVNAFTIAGGKLVVGVADYSIPGKDAMKVKVYTTDNGSWKLTNTIANPFPQGSWKFGSLTVGTPEWLVIESSGPTHFDGTAHEIALDAYAFTENNKISKRIAVLNDKRKGNVIRDRREQSLAVVVKGKIYVQFKEEVSFGKIRVFDLKTKRWSTFAQSTKWEADGYQVLDLAANSASLAVLLQDKDTLNREIRVVTLP